MRALTWDRLTEISVSQKPYRGTTNRFPIGDRRHNHKDFLKEERNGEQVYVVRYGYGWECIEHTKEEYLANQGTIHERTDGGVTVYESYKTIPRELGIVRPDNTFEFMSMYYGQGDNMMLSNWSRGVFFRSSRHGGMVYKEHVGVFHPIFKGMRLNCDTMMPHKDSEYQVTGKRVSRKDAKEFLNRYTDFYKINEVMLKAMDWKGYMETMSDVVKPLGITTENWGLMNDEKDKLIKFADENLNTAPLDAGIAFALVYDVQNLYSRYRAFNSDGSNYYSREVELDVVFANMKRKLNKELYKRNPSVMKLTEYVPNQEYPPSEWGVDITVNGKEVEQL
jgi:hypothetical protein